MVRDAIEYVYTVRNAGKSEGAPSASGCCNRTVRGLPGGGGGGGRGPDMKGMGMLVGNFELNP